MAGVTTARISCADLEKWPDDGRRYELYDGEAWEVPSPILLHQFVAGRLHVVLDAYVRQHGGVVAFAPLDIVLSDYDVVQPDLLLYTGERARLVSWRGKNRMAPDLAIEILSPATERNDRGRKMALLARHGVREYWLVDPERVQIEVFELIGGRFKRASLATALEAVRSPLLTGVVVRPDDLLPVLP